jgi:hypothetical protein
MAIGIRALTGDGGDRSGIGFLDRSVSILRCRLPRPRRVADRALSKVRTSDHPDGLRPELRLTDRRTGLASWMAAEVGDDFMTRVRSPILERIPLAPRMRLGSCGSEPGR